MVEIRTFEFDEWCFLKHVSIVLKYKEVQSLETGDFQLYMISKHQPCNVTCQNDHECTSASDKYL